MGDRRSRKVCNSRPSERRSTGVSPFFGVATIITMMVGIKAVAAAVATVITIMDGIKAVATIISVMDGLKAVAMIISIMDGVKVVAEADVATIITIE